MCMPILRLLPSIALGFALAGSAARADAPTRAQRIQQAKDALQRLVGDWVATGTFTADKPATMTYTWSCKPAALDNAVLCTMASSSPKMEEQQLFAYDAGSDRLHCYTANSWGEAYDHSGPLPAGDTIEAKAETTKNGRSFVEIYTWTFLPSGELKLEAKDTVGGAPGPHGEFTLKRR